MNKNVFILAAMGVGLFAVINRKPSKTVKANPKATTGTGTAPINSFDQLFSSRAQQPHYGGGSGVQAAVDLTGAGKAVWDAVSKLFSSTKRPPTNFTPYYSTWDDYRQAQQQVNDDKYGPVDDWYNGGTQEGPDTQPEFSSSYYGAGGLEASFESATTE